jgi:hypothetical protein
MAAETTICGMVPRDSLGFQKSLQITTRKEKPNYYQLNDVASGLITLAVRLNRRKGRVYASVQ